MRLHKQLMLAVATLVTSSFLLSAMGESVYSVNVVGFQKQELPPNGQFVLAAAPFKTGDPASLLSIFGTNTLRQDDIYLNCDRVIVYDLDSQLYQSWAQWTDGVFYQANSASQWAAGISGNPQIPTGTGFWIVSASSTQTNMITFVGDVALDDQVAVEVPEGLNILAYPFSSEIDIQDTGFFASGAAADDIYLNADRISVYDAGSYHTYAVWTDGQWYRANSASEWAEGILADVVFQPGQGFFYRGQNELLTWIETNRYLNALNE